MQIKLPLKRPTVKNDVLGFPFQKSRLQFLRKRFFFASFVNILDVFRKFSEKKCYGMHFEVLSTKYVTFLLHFSVRITFLKTQGVLQGPPPLQWVYSIPAFCRGQGRCRAPAVQTLPRNL